MSVRINMSVDNVTVIIKYLSQTDPCLREIIRSVGDFSIKICALLHDQLCCRWYSFDQSAFSLLVIIILVCLTGLPTIKA